jgi:pimeloyl-ACP methyl ester carboxylesterase
MAEENFMRRTLFVITFITAIIAPSFSLTAQRKPAANKTVSAPKCSGAWTGSVTYTRSQAMTNNKTEDRVSGRGKDTTNFEMKYDYKAKVTVTEANAKGTVDHKLTSMEKVHAVERNSCDRGKTWKEMSGTSISKTETTGNQDVEANINVGVNSDGTYTVSVRVPQIAGQTKGEQNSSYSGQCTHKEGKNFTMPATPTTIDGNSLTSDGTHRIEPSDPNRISGTYTYTWQNVTETVTWSLQKCGAPLRLTNLAFDDMKFPTWNEWKEITEQTGTIDGNLVKIKATVLNVSGETKYADVKFKETYKGDKWDGAKPDAELKDETISVRLEPGEEKDVEIVWDSSGYAWYDDGRPRFVQRIKAELAENNKKTDEMTKNLKVAPKPLVLVHGLWSNWRAWESWQNILTTSHSYDWKAFPVGEKADKGVMNTGGSFMSTTPTNSIGENARELETYIKYAQEDRNAWHVDIVAHSMGGLISRYYISQIMPNDSQDGRPKVSRLVMLGTPNMGSPCADVMNVAFEMLGKNVEAVRQLRQDYAVGFNRINVNRKGVKFSVLAGDPLPTMCKEVVWNDGVVPVESAYWNIKDRAKVSRVHTALTGTEDFSGFVKPRLAIGPKGDHNPAPIDSGVLSIRREPAGSHVAGIGRGYGKDGIDLNWLNVSSSQENGDPWAKAVKVGGKQIVEIDVPVEAVQNLGITFMAIPDISVTLINDKGVVVGKNLTKTPEANAWFRSIFVDKGITAGTWKLKIENTSDTEAEAVLTMWILGRI